MDKKHPYEGINFLNNEIIISNNIAILEYDIAELVREIDHKKHQIKKLKGQSNEKQK